MRKSLDVAPPTKPASEPEVDKSPAVISNAVNAATATAEVPPAEVTTDTPVVDVTNTKQRPKTYSDYLRRAGLDPKESAAIEYDGIRYIKVNRHLLATYRSMELPGIFFYPDNEDYSYLLEPKSEAGKKDSEWYLKSSEFTAVPDVRLGNEHLQEEHAENALLQYSSRRGISSKDRTYHKRHG